MRIYLVGYSYSGKTTMGRELARLLGYRFFDTDKGIEIKYHTTINMFFNRYGEPAFRIIEQQMLHSTADLDDVVIATGGGAACHGDNMQFILDHGIAIYLQMSLEQILQRIARARKGRPSLKGMDDEQRRQFISRQLSDRIGYYQRAHISFPAMDAEPQALLEAYQNYLASSPRAD
ncbi:MAG: shikimate kinase [Bacteroidales bacterium]|jgi:shikimate kinase|nr:shikimate kinase [Bacteroidales bacterium]